MQQTKLFPESQLEAYHTYKPTFGHMHQIIWEIIATHPGVCNTEILEILKKDQPRSNGKTWRINSITPRVKELREMGRVICIGYKPGEFSKVMAWGAV